MKKKYILLKETPELKKGAILEEKCEGGNQDYECFDKKYVKLWKKDDGAEYFKRIVENQPEWFEKIEVVELPIKHALKVKRFIKSLK